MRGLTLRMCLLGFVGIGLTVCGCAHFPKSEDKSVVEHRQRSAEMIDAFEAKRNQAQYQAALSRWEQQDTAGCRELVEKLLVRNPRHREARLLRAEIYLLEENPKPAIEDVEKLVSDNPQDAEAEHILALLLEATERGDEALAHFERAADLDPENEVFVASYQTAVEDQ